MEYQDAKDVIARMPVGSKLVCQNDGQRAYVTRRGSGSFIVEIDHEDPRAKLAGGPYTAANFLTRFGPEEVEFVAVESAGEVLRKAKMAS